MSFAIGVVLYNFQLEKLKKIIDEYADKAKNIIFVDNCSANINEFEQLKIETTNIKLIKNNKNIGIAKALNQILNTTIEINVDFLLTLDQDSYLKYDDLKKMMKYMRDDVAIVCPEILDLNKKKNKKLNKEYQEIERCITSGSLMNIKICKKIETFDEKMFIDYVDFDYCKKIRIEGYKILQIQGCFLQHEIGKRTSRKFLWIDVYPTNHSSFRVYYYFRNMHYYYLKYRKKMTIKEKINEIIRITWKYVSIILYEENKKEKLKKAKEGYKDTAKMLV